jgi:hypothetical protein
MKTLIFLFGVIFAWSSSELAEETDNKIREMANETYVNR